LPCVIDLYIYITRFGKAFSNALSWSKSINLDTQCIPCHTLAVAYSILFLLLEYMGIAPGRSNPHLLRLCCRRALLGTLWEGDKKNQMKSSAKYRFTINKNTYNNRSKRNVHNTCCLVQRSTFLFCPGWTSQNSNTAVPSPSPSSTKLSGPSKLQPRPTSSPPQNYRPVQLH
jgi:hypothetical protein